MGILKSIFAHCSQISRRTACHQTDYAPINSEISTSPGARKYLDLPTSRAQLFSAVFSRVQRANGRFFTFSAVKVNDRARAL